MRGSRNFRQGGGGGGPGQCDKKALTTFFSPQLILQSQMVNFKESSWGVQHFPGGGGSNFFRAGGFQLLIPIENI